jgi:thioredoxin 1
MNQLSSYQDYKKIIGCGVTLVDFSTPWCAPCRSQEPILERLVLYYEGKATIASMNLDHSNETAGELGIQSIPTLIIFKNGKEIQRFIGLQSEDILMDALNKMLN